MRVEWSSGGIFTTPPGWWHSHHNDTDTDAWVLPIQVRFPQNSPHRRAMVRACHDKAKMQRVTRAAENHMVVDYDGPGILLRRVSIQGQQSMLPSSRLLQLRLRQLW